MFRIWAIRHDGAGAAKRTRSRAIALARLLPIAVVRSVAALAIAAALVSLSPVPASAAFSTTTTTDTTLLDPLHGYCPGCKDTGSYTPIVGVGPKDQIKNFGFSISPGTNTGDFRLEVLIPDNITPPASADLTVTGTITTNNVTGPVPSGSVATSFSSTPWTGGDLDAYLGISGSPPNPLRVRPEITARFGPRASRPHAPTDQVPPDQVRGQARGHAPGLKAHETAAVPRLAYDRGDSIISGRTLSNLLTPTQTLDSKATGYLVYQLDVPNTTLPAQDTGKNSSNSSGYLSPLLNIGPLPLGSFILAFLNAPNNQGDLAWVATASSGSLFVPEPGSLALLSAGLVGFGLAWQLRLRRKALPPSA